MGDPLRRDPYMDGAEDLCLVDWPVLLAPLVKLDPRCFDRYIMYTANDGISYIFKLVSIKYPQALRNRGP